MEIGLQYLLVNYFRNPFLQDDQWVVPLRVTALAKYILKYNGLVQIWTDRFCEWNLSWTPSARCLAKSHHNFPAFSMHISRLLISFCIKTLVYLIFIRATMWQSTNMKLIIDLCPKGFGCFDKSEAGITTSLSQTPMAYFLDEAFGFWYSSLSPSIWKAFWLVNMSTLIRTTRIFSHTFTSAFASPLLISPLFFPAILD